MYTRELLAVGAIALLTSMALALSGLQAPAGMTTGATTYQDITPSEAYDLLATPANGIQIPIDVRTENEWRSERIDTPYPEYPRHFSSIRLSSSEGLQEFIDTYNGNTVILYCRSGSRSASSAQILTTSDFQGTIYNLLGGITAWKSGGYPTKQGNQAPHQPAPPTGPTQGTVGQELVFTASTVDPDGDVVRYGWDWTGDQEVDQWSDYYLSDFPANLSHSWEHAGVYSVRVRAEDHVGDESTFSSATVVTIRSDNNPPGTPDIDGPSRVQEDVEVNYTVVATDPDGDDVYYTVNFGDLCPSVEWLGPYPSGQPVQVPHIYRERGTYVIRAQAKDVLNESSDWGVLEVSVPLLTGPHHPWLAWLLDHLYRSFSVPGYW